MSRIIETPPSPPAPNEPTAILDDGDGILDDEDAVNIPDPNGGAPGHMTVSAYLGIEPSPTAIRLVKDMAEKQGLNCDRFSKDHPLKK